MKSLLITYHSQSGASVRLAWAAREGALLEPEVEVGLERCWDVGTGTLAAVSGLLLVAAENSGALSGGMKDFLDRIFYPAIARKLLLPYGLIISAGNDGRGACRQSQKILSGIPFTPVAEPLIIRGEPDGNQLQACSDLGQAFAAGLAMGIY